MFNKVMGFLGRAVGVASADIFDKLIDYGVDKLFERIFPEPRQQEKPARLARHSSKTVGSLKKQAKK